jgi:4-hydroxyphenylpyruvate dioxygenase
MAFRVSGCRPPSSTPSARAKPFVGKIGPMELNIPAIYGIGESTSPLSTATASKGSIYDVDFVFYPDWQARMAEVDAGLYEIDHLTHNVHRGNMNLWSNFYERIGNFREIRYFDIEGKLTGCIRAP